MGNPVRDLMGATFDVGVKFGVKGDEAVRDLLAKAASPAGHLSLHQVSRDAQGQTWLTFSARLPDSTEQLHLSVITYWNTVTPPERL